MNAPAHPDLPLAVSGPAIGDDPEVSAEGAGVATPAETSTEHGGRRLVPTWVAVLALVALAGLAVWSGIAIHSALSPRSSEQADALALQRAKERVASAPHDVGARLDLAYLYDQQRMPDSALGEYQAILRDSPDDVAALYGEGATLLATGQSAKAVTVLWRVLDIDKGHVRASSALGDHYAAIGQYRSLLVAVHTAVAMHPNEAHLQYLMGVAYEHIGRAQWAAQRYRLALQADPDTLEARQALARLAQVP